MSVPPPHGRPPLRLVLSISFSLFIFLSLLCINPSSAKRPLSGKRQAFSFPPEPRRIITPPSAPRGELIAPSKSSRSLPFMPDAYWDDLRERSREEPFSGRDLMSSANTNYQSRRTTTATPKPQCLYVTGYSSELKRVNSDGKLYLFDDAGDFHSQYLSVPMALGVDYRTDTLYVSTSSSIDQIEIGRNMSNGDKYCTCSFSTKEVAVFDIQTLDVNQADGGVYFGFHNEICFKPDNASAASCWVWPTSLVPANEEFKYIYINQHSQKLYAVSSIAMWVYYFDVSPNATVWLGGLWGTPGYLYNYANNAQFTGVASRNGSDAIYLSLPSFNYTDTSSGLSQTSDCLVVEATPDAWTVTGCWIPEAGLQAEQIYEPFFLYYYDGYFYTFIPNAPPGGGDDPTNALLRMNLQHKTDEYLYMEMADDWDWFIDQIVSPIDLLWAPCPYLPSPSPRPVSASSSDGLTTAAIVAPVVLGTLLGLFVVGVIVGFLAWNYYRKRRKYYAGQELCSDEIEMGLVKFTYREIEYQDLKLGRLLGEGAFGKVYKGEYRGAVVAVKLFEALRLDQADEKVINELRMEAQMMERLSNHPNIVKFVGAITRGNEGANFALVTEFCARGSLFDLLVKKKKKLPLITLVRMARDAASGILHLHKEHIVHRDIAARNILVGQNYEVYVADFGLARAQEAEGQVATTKQNFGPISWMAPEALRSREYSEATDAFSFGVLLWEMVERKRPWAGMEAVQIVTAVTSNTRLKIPKDCDPVFQRLMKMCWRHNPAHRPSFEKMVNTLSDYYKTLKQYQDADADAFEASGNDSDDEPEDLGEGMSYEEWQARRIKDEVKSFMKQLITERNDDYGVVAGAAAMALDELRSAFGVEDEGGETAPLLAKKQSSGQLSRKPLKNSGTSASAKKIIYDSLNESKAKKLGLKQKKTEKTGEEEEEEDDDGDIQFTGEAMRDTGAGVTSASSVFAPSAYMGLDEVNGRCESNKELLEREDSGELVRKRKPKQKQKEKEVPSAYAAFSVSEVSAPSNQANGTSPASGSPRGAARGGAEAGDEDQIYLFQANAETDEETEKENENEKAKAAENEGEAEAEAEEEGKGGGAKKSKNPLKKSLEAMKKLSERSLSKSYGGGLKKTEKNEKKKKRSKTEQARKKSDTKKVEAQPKSSAQEAKKSAEAELPPPAAAPQHQWVMPERKVKVSTLGSSIKEHESFYASILDSKQSLGLGSDDDSDSSSNSDSDSHSHSD